MHLEQDSQSHNSQIIQSQETHDIEQNLDEQLEQYKLNESIEYDKSKLKELSQQYTKKIQDYFQNLDQQMNKNKVKTYVEEQIRTFSQEVEKIFIKQSDKFKSEVESQIKQKILLIQNHQQEKNQKDQQIYDLTQKYNETNNSLIISSYNDDNIGSKITEMNKLLEKTFDTTIQANQQLDVNNLDQMQQQIQMIRQSITGNTQTQINNLQIQLNEKEKLIEKLQKEKQDKENQLRNNNSSVILTKKIEELLQQYKNQFNKADLINQKTNQIVEINTELNKLNSLINNENEIQKNKYEEDKTQAIQKQLEGCFKLQDRSLLYIQLGLKIFQQYYYSHFQNDSKIKSQLDRLNKFHQNYLKKENFKLKDLEEVEQFYIKQEVELKQLFDDSLKEYKNLINEITQNRRKYQ